MRKGTAGRLVVGMAGLGRMGARHAMNLATRVPGALLVAANDSNPDQLDWATKTLGVRRTYARFEEMLADREIEAVFLATPTTDHAGQIIAALEAGKHVFCEKPTSLDVDTCLRVEEVAAKHADRKVMIGYVRRFDPSYRDAYDKVASGAIGTPFLVKSHTLDKHDPSGFFVKFARHSGGIFLDMSVHDVDSARWFLGSPKPVRAFATGTVAVHEGLRDVPDFDNGIAMIEFEGGKMAVLQASRTMAHGHETTAEITGTTGRLTVGARARLSRVDIADAHGVRNECTPTFYERFEDAFVVELNAFTDAVRNDAPLPLTLRDATEATRICVAIQQSVRSKRSVDL
ncbi:MAG TPA: Gfo/Idh/MocA family oxidoreductase [Casimicrobiaceae bacterium]|nr:Gfo/Idh/MocA family oxidoreductase [Casimicrobiaceae bacterium]